jgi:hypothetical protein
MRTYEQLGTGLTVLPVVLPLTRVPAAVTLKRGWLVTPPSAQRIQHPPGGAWRNLAATDPADRAQITAIAARWGALTAAGATDGEGVEEWSALIGELGTLAGAWTADGDPADPVKTGAAWSAAENMQARLVEEHQDSGGRFGAFGAQGFALLARDMATWWRLDAIFAVYERFPLRRCRWCGHWFSVKGRRSDQSFGSGRCRSAFHQDRPPPSAPWAQVI